MITIESRLCIELCQLHFGVGYELVLMKYILPLKIVIVIKKSLHVIIELGKNFELRQILVFINIIVV
jgi:hypothetical protein